MSDRLDREDKNDETTTDGIKLINRQIGNKNCSFITQYTIRLYLNAHWQKY